MVKQKNNARDLDYCLNADEIAAHLGISRSAAYMLLHSAGFPSIHIGRRIVVPYKQYKEWLQRQIDNATTSN